MELLLDNTVSLAGLAPAGRALRAMFRRKPSYRVVWLADRPFDEAHREALEVLEQSDIPVLVRLSSQPFPELEQLNTLHDEGVPLVSIPDRFANPTTSHAFERLRVELDAALKNYLDARATFSQNQSAVSSRTQAAVEPDTGELSDEQRKAFLDAMSGHGHYDDGVR